MNPTLPVATNLRNRIRKHLGESGKERLNLTKKQYARWLEDRLRKADTVDVALDEALKIVEAKGRKS